MTSIKTRPMIEQLLTAIATGRTFLVASHENPDGDAIASSLALGNALRENGKEVTIFNQHGVPLDYRFLPGWETLVSNLPATTSLRCRHRSRRRRAAAGRHLDPFGLPPPGEHRSSSPFRRFWRHLLGRRAGQCHRRPGLSSADGCSVGQFPWMSPPASIRRSSPTPGRSVTPMPILKPFGSPARWWQAGLIPGRSLPGCMRARRKCDCACSGWRCRPSSGALRNLRVDYRDRGDDGGKRSPPRAHGSFRQLSAVDPWCRSGDLLPADRLGPLQGRFPFQGNCRCRRPGP